MAPTGLSAQLVDAVQEARPMLGAVLDQAATVGLDGGVLKLAFDADHFTAASALMKRSRGM